MIVIGAALHPLQGNPEVRNSVTPTCRSLASRQGFLSAESAVGHTVCLGGPPIVPSRARMFARLQNVYSWNSLNPRCSLVSHEAA